MDVNSLPKTVNRQRRGGDMNPGRTAPESTERPNDAVQASINTHYNQYAPFM